MLERNQIAAASQTLHDHWRAGTKLAALEEWHRPYNRAEGYAIQANIEKYSATHLFGSQRFKTRDDSKNSFWVAMLTFGEGWHNNHHAHPVSARHGLAWYEFDISWITLKVFNAIGLVSDLKVAKVREAMPVEEAA